jgi:hypothetical protein
MFASILAFSLQAGPVPPAGTDIFSPAEKAQIESAANVERRIKVYESASRRIQKTLEAAAAKDNFDAVPENLKLWNALLSKSLEDIEINLKAKKKSRALISYEIQVRKSIDSMKNIKIKAPVDQQDFFDSCLSEAEAVRKKFVEILFQH